MILPINLTHLYFWTLHSLGPLITFSFKLEQELFTLPCASSGAFSPLLLSHTVTTGALNRYNIVNAAHEMHATQATNKLTNQTNIGDSV